ncbi:alpha-ketoglutarate-dependent 2,4-dichlorophenoxyacetate dioxygenase [Leptodontidium sp. MPI-SDFR-AT-0119]|nr:alpha-ketoglutarate-dependent 2,4-dichlorophenoxyacetate dioxygenase [Leptodontidium sp. MPI-SDFR-AT-0119]
MPGSIDKELDELEVRELHPTYGAEISGLDFSKPIVNSVFKRILAASAKYGVLVFRSTGLDNDGHIEFSRRCGNNLFDMREFLPKGTKTHVSTELADLSNIDAATGKPMVPNAASAHVAKLTSYFHADLSYNPVRAKFSILKAHQLPPPGYGGNTEFTDMRTAFDELSEVEEGLKEELLAKDYVAAHSLKHLQKVSDSELFKDTDPTVFPMGKHKIVQFHEELGRKSLYLGAYIHHIDGPPEETEELAKLLEKLTKHAEQEKYQLSVRWKSPGDMILWDNRRVVETAIVMHRAGPGTFAGKFIRDVRRATDLDSGN